MRVAVALLLALAGCLQAGEPGDADAPGRSADPSASPSVTAAPQAPAAADPLAPWTGVPVVGEWQRLDCDQQRTAVPARTAWPPGPFNGSVAGLLRALEDAMQVQVTAVHASARHVVAEVTAADGTGTLTLGRGTPSLEWRLDHVWPGGTTGEAWAEANRTAVALGLPRPDVADPDLEGPTQWIGRFSWSDPDSGLRELHGEVATLADGSRLSRGGLLLWPDGGRWPAGMDNASLEAAGQAFIDCSAGPGYGFAYASTIPVAMHAAVGRWMTFRLPMAGHHCGGSTHEVAVDVATGVVLAHADGQPCV